MKLQASILLVSLAGLAAAQNITLHTVVVGSNGKLVFNPDTVIANVGDLIRFEYDPANHSVVQGSFANPCHPLTNGFFSGYVPSSSGIAPTVFDITINDTNPIYYYCSQAKHCVLGMVGVINPPANGSNSQSDYVSAAGSATNSTAQPNGVEGGQLLFFSNATTTTLTSTIGVTGTSTPSASGTGASAGSGPTTTTGGSASGTATGSTTSTSTSAAAPAAMEKQGTLAALVVVIGLGINLL
ncbi:MAG: hypothetical protein MMC33_005138 [Icmadophila ericetorum]|nr:hypothetical protein [Icmadophila ericetorum]